MCFPLVQIAKTPHKEGFYYIGVWSLATESNRKPFAYKTNALPIELARRNAVAGADPSITEGVVSPNPHRPFRYLGAIGLANQPWHSLH